MGKNYQSVCLVDIDTCPKCEEFGIIHLCNVKTKIGVLGFSLGQSSGQYMVVCGSCGAEAPVSEQKAGEIMAQGRMLPSVDQTAVLWARLDQSLVSGIDEIDGLRPDQSEDEFMDKVMQAGGVLAHQLQETEKLLEPTVEKLCEKYPEAHVKYVAARYLQSMALTLGK